MTPLLLRCSFVFGRSLCRSHAIDVEFDLRAFSLLMLLLSLPQALSSRARVRASGLARLPSFAGARALLRIPPLSVLSVFFLRVLSLVPACSAPL
jgi:hypothetical protein